MSRAWWLLVAVAAGGCTQLHVDAATVREQDVELEITQAVSGCSGMLTFGETVATFTLSPDQRTCHVHLEVAGSFVDIADVKQAYSDEIDGYPDTTTVSVFGLNAEITDVSWVDGVGNPLGTPTIPAWSANVAVAGVPVVVLQGSDAASLLAGVSGLDLSGLVAPFNTAVEQNGSLPMSGTVDVALDMASLARVLAGHVGIAVDLKLNVHLRLHVTRSAWDEL